MSAEAGVRVDFYPDVESRTEVLARAMRRGRDKRLLYAGEVTPAEAWRLHESGAARLIDVRTHPEWELVGRVPGVPLVEWRRYGDPIPNEAFLDELARHVAVRDTVLFLCRSGVRSHHAAQLASRAGYARAFNVVEGFEGDLDAKRQRGGRTGWRAAGLPWEQS